jgi:intracellular sulfur oxidation DsrE/DsrF family protein
MQIIRRIGMILILALVSAIPAAAQTPVQKQKVVYHINSDGGEGGKLYRAALQNVRNHIEALGAENVEIKVVMHGDGLGLLKQALTDMTLQGAVSGLKNDKVTFNVCGFTLKRRNIDPDKDLFEVLPEDIVKSGVAEIAKLQTQGYVYIKP